MNLLYELYNEIKDCIFGNFDKIDQNIESSLRYIVSSNWIISFQKFVEVLLDKNTTKAFERKFVLKQFFYNCMNPEYDDSHIFSYPGPINNYCLIDFNLNFPGHNCLDKRLTSDIERTNFIDELFFLKNLKKSDFYLIEEKLYNKLKMMFSSLWDIPIYLDESYNLKLQVSVLFSENQRKLYSEISFPKYILLNSKRKIKTVNCKISHLISNEILQMKSFDSVKDETKENLEDMEFYLIDKTNEELIKNIIFCYKTGIDHYYLNESNCKKVEFDTTSETLVEVNF